MIFSQTGNDYCVVTEARLKSQAGKPIRFVSTAKAAIDYLTENPDTDFLLEVNKTGADLSAADVANADHGEVIRCGQVRYDSKTEEVVWS